MILKQKACQKLAQIMKLKEKQEKIYSTSERDKLVASKQRREML